MPARLTLPRLILALLIAAFALPALANGPCHAGLATVPVAMEATTPHHGSHGQPHPDGHAVVPHVCIGCIPPASLLGRGVAVPLAVASVAPWIAAVRFDPASGTPPALPPPRDRA